LLILRWIGENVQRTQPAEDGYILGWRPLGC